MYIPKWLSGGQTGTFGWTHICNTDVSKAWKFENLLTKLPDQYKTVNVYCNILIVWNNFLKKFKFPQIEYQLDKSL